MSRVFLAAELEGVATFWCIFRRDGVAMGFTGHDRDLAFGGLIHRAAPGMLPSAILRTAGLAGDSAEMEGALAHDGISSRDLAAGRFDGARVEVGAVDWETREHAVLYNGTIGAVTRDGGAFTADLVSAKAALDVDLVPRTAPTCRAAFCGPQCGLSAVRYTHLVTVVSVDADETRVRFERAGSREFVSGTVRWLDGPHAGLAMAIVDAGPDGFVLDAELDLAIAPGTRALLREGCDHSLDTCNARFGNAINFRGEPFLPGNDLLARYPVQP